MRTLDVGPSNASKVEECESALFLTHPLDDRAGLISLKGRAIPGTCTWLTRNETFVSWRDNTNTSPTLLWLSGGPGKGKTMLSIFLTQELEKDCFESTKMILLYYFCDARDEKRNSPVSILRGLIFLFLQQRPSLINCMLNDYRVQRDNLFKENSLEALWRIFESMIRESKSERIYCVLDGLDECRPQSLDHFLKKVRGHFEAQSEALVSDGRMLLLQKPRQTSTDPATRAIPNACSLPEELPDFRMMIISRDEPSCLTTELGSFPRIQLSDASNGAHPSSGPEQGYESGLATFIEAKAEEVSNASRESTPTATAAISRALSKGDKTFLWVQLAVAKLRSPTSQNVSTNIEQLPNKIEKMYTHTLLQVPAEWASPLAAILHWLVISVRPLELEELQIAVSLSLSSQEYDDAIMYCLTLCPDLVSFRDNRASLAHQSARDYLISPRSSIHEESQLAKFCVETPTFHGEAARLCLEYLGSGAMEKGSVHVAAADQSTASSGDVKRCEKYPFMKYAVLHWPDHARMASLGSLDFDIPFFASKSALRNHWWTSYWVSTRSQVAWRSAAPLSFTILHLAGYCGILGLAHYVEKQGLLTAQLSKRDSHGQFPLEYSIQHGHFPLTKFFVDRGALTPRDWLVDEFGSDGMITPLEDAARAGDAETIKLLISRGTQPDRVNAIQWNWRRVGTMVYATARYCHGAVSSYPDLMPASRWRLILMRDYGDDERAIHIASSYGNDSAVEALLANGSNIEVATTGGWKAIHVAAWFGRLSTVQLLLRHGAEAGSQCNDGWTAIHCASSEGHSSTVRALVAGGCPLDAKSTKHKTALYVACYKGNLEAVKILAESGADLSASTIQGVTPLHISAWGKQEDIVRYLVKAGADVEIENYTGFTAYDVAMDRKNYAIASFLKEAADDSVEQRLRLLTAMPKLEEAANSTELTSVQIPQAGSNLASEGLIIDPSTDPESLPTPPATPAIGPAPSTSQRTGERAGLGLSMFWKNPFPGLPQRTESDSASLPQMARRSARGHSSSSPLPPTESIDQSRTSSSPPGMIPKSSRHSHTHSEQLSLSGVFKHLKRTSSPIPMACEESSWSFLSPRISQSPPLTPVMEAPSPREAPPRLDAPAVSPQPQSQSSSVWKSRSFVDLNIMGKKIL